MKRRLRWRRALVSDVPAIVEALTRPDSSRVSLAARHMFALATIEAQGPDQIRLLTRGRRLAATVVIPGKLVVPCGDAGLIAAALPPSRRWRLMVGDVDAARALLATSGDDPSLVVHDQRFMMVDPQRVPDERGLANPGLRRAEPADVDRLADLAVQLHVDDQFGPHPGPLGWRGYRQRLETTVRQGLVWCVGPVGQPVCKVERSVSSLRWGVQLAGIVVDPRARHAGLGRAAVAAAVRDAMGESTVPRPVSLHVRANNAPAINAYAAAGFVDGEAWCLAVRP